MSGAIALLVAGGALPALAQDIRIDVTGSNIRRPEGEGALPVQIITREEIDRTGAQTAAELLQFVTANNSRGAVTVANVIGAQNEQRFHGLAARPRGPAISTSTPRLGRSSRAET